MKLFIDTNAFFSLLTEKQSKISDILEDKRYELVTNILVINELKFKLSYTEAVRKLRTDKKYRIIKEIKKNRSLREKILKKFAKFHSRLVISTEILEVSEKDDILSNQIMLHHGLLPTDATIAATMMNNNIINILTNDKDFEKVSGIEILKS